ncbi:fibronectin type III domain-containing protein [Paenibacillus zeisoli]|uniref:Fibronectin type III domain-containing protein n=1 Tax=Paenibacillus zeisoli TaxID=2496267 RepID=A0A3S1JS41_9BACL|nr:Ig-like domain-containing protein [Paenibacillus zeisoli]RUT35460.1 fibronectin type III domain-containing protein [Paenibacillus zeisoli]
MLQARPTFRKLQSVPQLTKLVVVLSLIFSLLPIYLPNLPKTYAESAITIDSPTNGSTPSDTVVRITGHYSEVYNISLVINGTRKEDVHMEDDASGTESGTWYYDLDTSVYDGAIEIAAGGQRPDTRYGISTPFVVFNVDHPEASKPVVEIVSPEDGSTITGIQLIKVKATGRNPLSSVQIRINGGSWKNTILKGNLYEYAYSPVLQGDQTLSIEAKATDDHNNMGKSSTKYVYTGKGIHEPVIVEKQDRAMWLWEKAAYNLILNPGSKSALEQFTSDTSTFNSGAVTTIYMGVFPHEGVDMLEDKRKEVRKFLKWAHEHGLKIQACIAGGTIPPYYGSYKRYNKYAINEIERVINFNLSSQPGERFDGVNVDVEPYILGEFGSSKPQLQIDYLDLLQTMMDRRNLSGLNLPVGPAIPRWYDTSNAANDITWHGQTKWMSQHVQDITDYISIMDYTDSSKGIIDGAQGEIDYANSINKPNSVIVGVETLDIANSGDPESITFREEGRTYMESQLAAVYQKFNGSPAFGGIAMHHYDSIRWLPSEWGPNAVLWKPQIADTTPPTPINKAPEAVTFDYQTIKLTYGRAIDNSDIEEYRVYRSTSPNFTPSASNYAGKSYNLDYTDEGLLPETTYYYRVAAVDISGNVGPYSSITSATTGNTHLKPMVIGSMKVTLTSGKIRATLKVKDLNTNEELAALVYGRFTYMAGKYVSLRLVPGTTVSADSETVPTASGQAGFAPQRIIAPGYYWASAYDTPHTATLVWPQQLQSVTSDEPSNAPEPQLDQEPAANPDTQPQVPEPAPDPSNPDDSQ